MTKSHYTHILFDLDNTILSFDHASGLAFDNIVSDLGLGNPARLYSIYKVINKKVWAELEEGKITLDEVRSKRWRLFFDEIQCNADPLDTNDLYLHYLTDHIKFEEGAMDLLRYFYDRKITMCIITNGLKEVQRPRINKAAIGHFFESIVVSDEIGIAKPHTDFFDFVMSELDHPDKQKTLIVGDTLQSDIRGGEQYGIDTCWYNPKNANNELDITPTYTINRLEELQRLVIG